MCNLELSKEIFNVDQVITGVIPTGDDKCRFDASVFERVIKSLIEEKLEDEKVIMAEIAGCGPDPCPTFVVATSAASANSPAVLFRSYSCTGYNANKCPIWQAARSPSAAPSFFRPSFVDVLAPGGWYIDGGLRHNNPSQLALDEARRIWPTVERFCLVSIGTGRQRNVKFVTINESQASMASESKSRFQSVLGRVPGSSVLRTIKNTPGGGIELRKHALSYLLTQSQFTEPCFKLANSPDLDQRFPYHRFNVENGMGSIGPEEWKANVRIGEFTAEYMREFN
jgi:hypothetical protein